MRILFDFILLDIQNPNVMHEVVEQCKLPKVIEEEIEILNRRLTLEELQRLKIICSSYFHTIISSIGPCHLASREPLPLNGFLCEVFLRFPK